MDPNIVKLTDNLVSITYYRFYRNIPVKDSKVQFVFTRQESWYNLAEIVNHSYGYIDIETGASTPSVADLQYATGIPSLNIKSSRPVIFPKNNREDRTYRFYDAEEFLAVDDRSGEAYSIILDKKSLEILEASAFKWHAKHQVLARTYERSYYYGGTEDIPLQKLL